MNVCHNVLKPRTGAFSAAICAVALALPLFADPVQIVPGDYAKSFNVAFVGYRGTETLVDFPVLVKLSADLNDFKYSKCKVANGGDLRFADADGNLLASEVDTWDEDGTSLVWVKVPAFNKNTMIKAYYGNDNPPAVNSQDVWSSGYVAVWHMNDTGTTMTDSSNGGTSLAESKEGSILAGQSGLFGNAVEFAKLSDYSGGLATSNQRYRTSGVPNFTVEFWSFQDSFDPANMPNNMTYIREVDASNHASVWYFYAIKSTGYGSPGKSVCQIFRNGGVDAVTLSTGSVVPQRGEWVYQYFRVEEDSKFYQGMADSPKISYTLNGAPGVTNIAGTTKLYIGNQGISNGTSYHGKIDEVRISNVVRSEDWMKAMYDMGTSEDFVIYESDNDWTQYTHKFSVSFTNYTGTTTLENFPVLVKLSEYDEATGTGIRGFSYADFKKANGADLRFSDENGNLLASEVEVWDTTGESVVWVKLPTLVPSVTNSITAYYGWSFAPHMDITQVWDNNYTAVWHMNGDATAMLDSSSGGTTLKEHSDNAGKNLYGQEGIVGTAVEFDHAGDHKGGIESSDQRYRLAAAESFTIELWAKQDVYDPVENPLDRYMAYLGEVRLNGGWLPSYQFRDIKTTSGLNGKTHFAFIDGSLDAAGKAVSRYLQNGNRTPPWKQWNYQVVRYNGTQYVHSLNAEQLATLTCNPITNIVNTTVFVGNDSRSAADAYSGRIDEIRFSSVPRSDDWIQATHESIRNTAEFVSYGIAKPIGKRFMVIIR